MTQLFVGHKPGVGPVVKVLKHDGDDALTLANDAYSRYMFNSENQRLSYILGNMSPTLGPGAAANGFHVLHFGGDTSSAWLTAKIEITQQPSTFYLRAMAFSRVDNVLPGHSFLPMFEARAKHEGLVAYRSADWVINQTNNEWGTRTSRQFLSSLMKVQARADWNSLGFIWQGRIPSEMTMIPIGSWVGVGISGTVANFSPPFGSLSWSLAYWHLPADSTPLPTYAAAPGLETVRLSRTKVAVARPGYDVATGSGPGQMIIDSDNLSPALCIMAGVTAPIAAANGTIALSPPAGIALSDGAIIEVMVRKADDEQFIPMHVPSGLSREVQVRVSYVIAGNQLVFTNQSTFPIVITYFVFNSDTSGTSTGGTEVIFKGNDGSRDFIQIKKPGTSDPASKPNDILLDTRFPTIHILKEGWLPAASFADAPFGADRHGEKFVDVTFDDGGLVPFVKFSIVFPNHITPPINTLWYQYTGFTPIFGPASNQSALCRLRPGVARFWINPGNFTRMVASGSQGVASRDGPDPLGLRYYIFGIPT